MARDVNEFGNLEDQLTSVMIESLEELEIFEDSIQHLHISAHVPWRLHKLILDEAHLLNREPLYLAEIMVLLYDLVPLSLLPISDQDILNIFEGNVLVSEGFFQSLYYRAFPVFEGRFSAWFSLAEQVCENIFIFYAHELLFAEALKFLGEVLFPFLLLLGKLLFDHS